MCEIITFSCVCNKVCMFLILNQLMEIDLQLILTKRFFVSCKLTNGNRFTIDINKTFKVNRIISIT